MIRKIAYNAVLILLLISMSMALYIGYQFWKYELFKTPVYETQAPVLPEFENETRILLFSKTNSYRHLEAIPAAESLFSELAQNNGWDLYITENGAVHNTEQLKTFDLIIWNSVTGDVLTDDQQVALKAHMEQGGRFLGLHGTGGNEEYQWQWIPENLIRAQFIGHPMFPQFREARLHTENREHPATRHMPEYKNWLEEWYSFEKSPRAAGVDVLASVDESEYQVPETLKMGLDHPLIWHHKVGEGTVFYSALGHLAEAYEDEEYKKLLTEATHWLLEQ